jgi:LysM repeat protein
MNRFFGWFISKLQIDTPSIQMFGYLFLIVLVMVTGCSEFSNPTNDEEREPYFLRGQKLESGSNFAAAAEAYEKALSENPKNASAHFRLCFLNEEKLTNYIAAIYHGEKYIKLSPNTERSELVRQHIQYSKSEIAKALPDGLVSTSVSKKMDQLQQTNSLLKQRIAELEQQKTNHQSEITVLQRNLTATSNQVAALTATIKSLENRKISTPSTVNNVRSASLASSQVGSKRGLSAKTYQIQSGDTLSRIAEKHNVSLKALKNANPRLIANKLKVGQSIKIP